MEWDEGIIYLAIAALYASAGKPRHPWRKCHGASGLALGCLRLLGLDVALSHQLVPDDQFFLDLRRELFLRTAGGEDTVLQ